MADGDVILPLQFEDGLFPDPPPPFAMGSCGLELYRALAPLAADDEPNGWPLARLCEALGRMRQPVSDLVRAWEEPGVEARSGDGSSRVIVAMPRSGWSRAAHPSRAPGAAVGTSAAARHGHIDLLPFVGQLAGVRGIEQLGTAERREAIRSRDGYSRGQPAAVKSYAQKFLTGTDGVTLRERFDPTAAAGADAPHHGRILLKRSRVRDLARVNLMPNPRAEVDLNNVSIMSTALRGANVSRVPCTWHADASVTWCFRVAGVHYNRSQAFLGVNLGRAGAAGIPVVSGQSYTASAQVHVTHPAADENVFGITWSVTWHDARGYPMGVSTEPGLPDDLALDYRLRRTVVAPPGAAFASFHILHETNTDGALAFEVTAVMIEETAELNPFADVLTLGWRAQGTPHASPSQGPGITIGEIQRRVLTRVPAGLLYDVVVTDDRDWLDVSEAWDTWAEVDSANTDWADVLAL